MLYISEELDGSQVINLTRGDDAAIEVPLSDENGMEYVLGENDYLIFDVRVLPRENSKRLIHLESSPGSNRIEFPHEITENLKVGQYSAEIQLMTGDKRITVWPTLTGEKKTDDTVNRKNFVLMPEVVMP